MDWQQRFIEAIQEKSLAKIKDVFRSLSTDHASTPKQAEKTKAIQILKSFYNSSDKHLYEIAYNLSNASDETCEEIGLIILAEKYHINPREVTQVIYKLSDSPNWEVREWAASACSIVLTNHFDDFGKVLMKWVVDESPNIRRCVAVAVKYVSKLKKIEFFPRLIELIHPLLYDNDPYVKKNLGGFAIGDGLLKNYPLPMVNIIKEWVLIDNEYVRSNIALIFTSAAAAKNFTHLEIVFRVLKEDNRMVVVNTVKQAETNLKKRLPQFSEGISFT